MELQRLGFLSVNVSATDFSKIFRNQNLGRKKLKSILKSVCGSLKIGGSNENAEITLHSLRGTAASILLESGCSDSNVAMRTGHRDLRSLKS